MTDPAYYKDEERPDALECPDCNRLVSIVRRQYDYTCHSCGLMGLHAHYSDDGWTLLRKEEYLRPGRPLPGGEPSAEIERTKLGMDEPHDYDDGNVIRRERWQR